MATARRPRQARPETDAGAAPTPAPRFSRLFKQIAGGIGFVSSVAGLVFLFLPQLQPKDSPATPAPAQQFGRLSGIVLDADTTQRQYLDRSDQTKDGKTPEQLTLKGAFVQFRAELVGYKGKTIPLQREVVDARTGDELGQVRAWTITPPVDRTSGPLYDWVPLRPGKGSYVLVIKLLDERRERALDCIVSPRFGGRAGLVAGKPQLGLCPKS
jgi:hypothetical protein